MGGNGRKNTKEKMIKRNKQTGGMRIERDKSDKEERKRRGIERRFDFMGAGWHLSLL